MADPARASKRGGKQGGLTRKLTLNAVEMVEKAGVVQRRRIRRLPSRRPAGARGRTRRLHWLRARFLLPVDVVDDDEALGHRLGASRLHWPRGYSTALRRVPRAATNRAREERRELVEGGNGTGGRLGVSRRQEVVAGKQEVARHRRHAHNGGSSLPGARKKTPLSLGRAASVSWAQLR